MNSSTVTLIILLVAVPALPILFLTGWYFLGWRNSARRDAEADTEGGLELGRFINVNDVNVDPRDEEVSQVSEEGWFGFFKRARV